MRNEILRHNTASHLSMRQKNLMILAEAATLAPSGDNTQGWQIGCDRDQQMLEISVDPARDSSPMNAGQRMSRIAVGAAAENVVRTAKHNNLRAHVEIKDAEMVVVRLKDSLDQKTLRIDDVVRNRCTNRKPYNGQPLSHEILSQLAAQTSALDGIQTHWLVSREQINSVAQLVASADAIMFGQPLIRKAFFENIRFDLPDHPPVEEGLSLGALELTGLERTGFQLIPKMPTWLFALGRVASTIGKKSQKLVQSGSGLCVLMAPDANPATDFRVGHALQRAWLTLTSEGLAVQPMMSLLVLENVRQYGEAALQRAIGLRKLEQLDNELRQFTAEFGAGRAAFLLRFGYAPPPSARCGRRPPQLKCT